MNVINWLEEKAPGLHERSDEERNAIMHFSLLWSLFEAMALDTRGNTKSIFEASRRWANMGLLTEEIFKHELAYFQNRYYADGEFTYHFGH
jgi:hypothetical protein